MPKTKTVLIALAAVAAPALVHAQGVSPLDRDLARYEVTVTNITRGQQFTPILAVSHRDPVRLFRLGAPASPELQTLAEEGNTAPFVQLLASNRAVTEVLPGQGLTNPGASFTFVIEGRPAGDRLSIAAMLIPTNDTFVALNAVDLPESGKEERHFANAYDSGTEVNDELCASIPGPFFVECKGSGGGARVGGGEGYVYVGNGIHGVGDFVAASRDWNNPVALVRIRRIR
ncbi:MAG TPA: spondin domain-containing protein [Burkholderiaceae bacterium]|nr:spondin domain-containing protein [Burkholderiaceae bacterium]